MSEQFGKFVGGINLGNEGDGIDTLHFSAVPKVCMGCVALLLLMKFMAIKPILCWIPYQFTVKDWVEYAHFYCYVSNTFLPKSGEVFTREAVDEVKAGDVNYIEYYQWVPFIFIVIAIVFYLPRLVWQGILEAEGVNITAMVKTVNGFESAFNTKKRETSLNHLSKYMLAHFTNKQKTGQKSVSTVKRILNKVLCISRSDSSYVGRMYLLVKGLQVFNAVVVLFVINIWIDGYHLYGFDVLMALFKQNYDEVNKFPFITFCNMTKRDLVEENTHTFQCLLTMNLFYEKIFFLFWFYLLFVLVKTLINAFGWTKDIIFNKNHVSYIRGFLKRSTGVDYETVGDAELQRFVKKFLRPDGVFIFKLIQRNTQTIVMSEVVGKLWNLYKEEEQKRLAPSAPPNGNTPSPDRKDTAHLYPTLPK